MHKFFTNRLRIFFIAILLCMGEGEAALASIKVGVTAGPHEIIMEQVKKEAKKHSLDIEIIVFNDFILPNAALDSGDLDVNVYQHLPFLIEQNKARGYTLHNAGQSVLMPLGIYSTQLKTLKNLPKGSKIAIPNDPTNGGRALKLLEVSGLIKLNTCSNPSVLDIKENPHNFEIIELEAPQLPRSLTDVAIAVINTDWIVLAKMDPNLALLVERTDSPYTNIIAVRKSDEARPEIKKFIEIYQSKAVRKFVKTEFKGAVLSAW